MPIQVLSHAYCTALYDKASDYMFFEVTMGKSTSITRLHFYKILELSTEKYLIHSDPISSVDIYTEDSESNGLSTYSWNGGKIAQTEVAADLEFVGNNHSKMFCWTNHSLCASKHMLALVYAFFMTQR